MSQLDLAALFRNTVVERDKLCSDLLKTSLDTRVGLLFGSRQAGKSAVLRHLVNLANPATADVAILCDLDIPVYVDLMRLQFDATPGDFFSFLIQQAQDACVNRISGFAASTLHSRKQSDGSPDVFANDILLLRQCAGEVNVRFIFLLDEAKRILGHRFPRGFQDNLYALLFNPDLGVGDYLAFVFSGAQHLYQLFDDDTSPLGSRAVSHLIPNISEAGVHNFGKLVFSLSPSKLVGEFTAWAYTISSGQAGLTAALLRMGVESGSLQKSLDERGALLERLRIQSSGLVANWASSFSNEARIFSLGFGSRQSVSARDVSRTLKDHGLDSFAADRVVEELRFTGAVVERNGRYVKANPLLWGYLERHGMEDAGTQPERETWGMIEESELVLREFIRNEYEGRWTKNALDQMKAHLGVVEWSKILEMQKRSEGKYPYSPQVPIRDEMSCMYLGQLLTLMIHGQAWPLFKDLFRDKRQLEDLLAAISPVRADRAHFNNVPEKELTRCKIACDDLVVIVNRR